MAPPQILVGFQQQKVSQVPTLAKSGFHVDIP